jgi:hypothetical protein
VVGIDPVPGLPDSGVLDDDRAGLFIEVGEVAKEQGIGVSFTIDEIRYLSMEYLAALIVDLHRVSHEQLPFMVERMERIGDLGDICWLNAQ